MPLTLRLVGFLELCRDKHDTNSQLLVNYLMDQVFSQQHRWEDVRLDVTCLGDVVPSTIHDPLNLTLDLGKTGLMKRMAYHTYACDSQRFVLVLAQCNRLETLRLGGNVEILIPNSITSHVPVYLPNLCTLALCSRRLQIHEGGWTLLGASPNIVDLTLDVEYSRSLRVTPPLSLLKLNKLVLNAWPLLDHMDLPSLNQLCLVKVLFNDEFLFVMSEPLSQLALETALCSLNKLECLSLNFKDYGDIQPESVFRMLTLVLSRPPPGNHSDILPRLKELDITASPSAILARDEITSVIGHLVVACKQRCSSGFRMSITCGSGDDKLRDRAERSLCEEMHIRQCVTKAFKVSVNYKRLEMGPKTDPET